MSLNHKELYDETKRVQVKFSDKFNDLQCSTFIQESCPEDLILKRKVI